jgi:hypothetical protein
MNRSSDPRRSNGSRHRDPLLGLKTIFQNLLIRLGLHSYTHNLPAGFQHKACTLGKPDPDVARELSHQNCMRPLCLGPAANCGHNLGTQQGDL